MSKSSFTKGLHEIAPGCWAWLQPDGSWGYSNAGLITDGEASLLVDTLFDLHLTADMLAAMRDATGAAKRIDTVVNTHANGDHCYGNALVKDATILASRACAEEMDALPPSVLAQMMKAAPPMGPAGEFLGEIFGHFDFEGIEHVKPSQTFEGELAWQVGDKQVQLIEVGPVGGDGVGRQAALGAQVTQEGVEKLVAGSVVRIGHRSARPRLFAAILGGHRGAAAAVWAADPGVLRLVTPGRGL